MLSEARDGTPIWVVSRRPGCMSKFLGEESSREIAAASALVLAVRFVANMT